MNMFRIGILLFSFLALAISFLYAVLDPADRRCAVAVQSDPNLMCPRFSDLGVTLVLVLSAMITLFGTLAIDGAQNADGSFRESRMRVSIATTILVVYLIYFGMAILWGDTGSQVLLNSFTNLMMVVIPFYFASSAAVEWSENKGKS